MPKLLYDYNAKTLQQFFNDKDVKREMCRSIALHCGNSSGGSGVSTFNTRTGDITLTSGDVTTALGYTPSQITSGNNFLIAGTNASGNIIDGSANVITRPLTGYVAGTNTVIANTDTILQAFQKTQGQITARATVASPTFTGVPAAPTAAVGTNTTQLATTAFVQAAFTNAYKGGQSAFTPDGTTTQFDIVHNAGFIPSFFTLTTTEPIASNHLNRTITFPNNNTMRLTFALAPSVGEDANYVWVVFR